MGNEEEIVKYLRRPVLMLIIRPRATKTKIVAYDPVRDALRVAVAAPPENNKANKEIVKFFSRLLKKRVRIIKGATGKQKMLAIDDER